MTDRSGHVTTIAIPAARGLLGETEPAEFFDLPLAVKTGLRDRQLLGVVVLIVVLAHLGIRAGEPLPTIGIAIYVMLGLLGARMTVAVGLAIAYRFRPEPTLVLDETGLRDLRSGAAVEWGSVAAAEIVTPIFNVRLGVMGVKLRLREPGLQPRVSPFWDGALIPALDQKPGQLYVPVTFLARSARPLAMAIAAMVRLHGGRTSVTGMGVSKELLQASVSREPAPE
jgi:hypothetical protein